MKIVEVITPVNAGRTVLGPNTIKLELDTETDELSIDTPAMFGDPVVSFTEMLAALQKLAEVKKRFDE